MNRDRLVQQRMAQQGVVARTFKDHVVFEAEEVRGSTGKPLQRYSAYRRRWWEQWRHATPPVLPTSPRRHKAIDDEILRGRQWPSPEELGYKPVAPWIIPGEDAARKRSVWFLDGPIHSYRTKRNLPAEDARLGSLRISALALSRREPRSMQRWRP